MEITYKHYRMSGEQLARFLTVDGLHVESTGALLAPRGEKVGTVIQIGEGASLVLIFEEGYTRGRDEVRAWWPGFRPAWIIVVADGETEIGDTLGPGDVICDRCNANITIRPVPVIGDWALCPSCFARLNLPFPGRVEPYDCKGQNEGIAVRL